jgi:hypothetical protein
MATVKCGYGPANDGKDLSIADSTTPTTNKNAANSIVDSLKQSDPVNISPGSSTTNVAGDWLLIPGIAAGNTKINSDAAPIFARLGKPDQENAAMMKAVAIWYANHDTNAHSIGIYTARGTDSGAVAAIKQIRVTSPSFKTTAVVNVTSTISFIKQSFKQLKQVETYTYSGKQYKVFDSSKGIAFEIAPDGTCVAVIIHQAGANKYGTYLKFRPDN